MASFVNDLDLLVPWAFNPPPEEPGVSEGILKALMRKCSLMADIDHDFLFDEFRNLLAIGYNVSDLMRDPRLLRPSGFRGLSGELRGHSPGKAPSEPLVLSGKADHHG